MQLRSTITASLVLAGCALASAPASAIVVSSFGPGGEAGYFHGRPLTIGTGGDVFELDAFLRVGGSTSILSAGGLPAGLDYLFGYSLSGDATDLTLSYRFVNNTGSVLTDLSFFSYLDAEIDEPLNTFFNEYGVMVGSPGSGASDPDPDSWEIDEPGFVFGDIYTNLLSGALDDFDAVTLGAPDGVAMALGFSLGSLDPLDAVTIRMLISEDGASVGSLALVQRDADSVDTAITFSGRVAAAIPEPSSALLLLAGLFALQRRRRSAAKRE